MEMTYHCREARKNRVKKIINEIGLGAICRETYHKGCYICITNTGITIVMDERHEKVVTMYVTTVRELIIVYHGKKKIPKDLLLKVERNQIKYIRNGKTIW